MHTGNLLQRCSWKPLQEFPYAITWLCFNHVYFLERNYFRDPYPTASYTGCYNVSSDATATARCIISSVIHRGVPHLQHCNKPQHLQQSLVNRQCLYNNKVIKRLKTYPLTRPLYSSWPAITLINYNLYPFPLDFIRSIGVIFSLES